MQLFASNCTPQDFRYNYRVPESDRALYTDIPSGQTRRIGDANYNAHQIEGIIEQGKLYGCYDINDLERAPDGQMVTLVFSRDKPVNAEVIRDVNARNRKDLTAVGAERRKELAIAAARVMNQNDPTQSDRASVGFEEEQPGTISTESGSALKEGYAGPESRVAKENNLGGNNGNNSGSPLGRRAPRGGKR